MKLLVLAVLIGTAFASQNLQETEKQVWSSVGEFGHQLSQKLNSLNSQGNMLFSPMSVATAMSMALIGARGSTKQEMLHSMKLHGVNDEVIEQGYAAMLKRQQAEAAEATAQTPDGKETFMLLPANRLYVSNRSEIKADYQKQVRENFLADALNVDFVTEGGKIQHDINAFVEERTKGLIKDILKEPLSKDSLMAIINTLYFKGLWSKTMREASISGVFNGGCDGLNSEYSTQLLVNSRFRYLESTVLKAQMILLPYNSGNFSTEMLIVLPNEDHNCKSQAWFNNIKWEDIKAELTNMKTAFINFKMPALELNARYSLETVLPTLGMNSAFVSGKADFKGIADDADNIDQVIHQTKMSITKFGTEAAAATVIAINRLAAILPMDPIPFDVNRSFYLSILYRERDDLTNVLPLFTGIVNKV